MLLYNPLGRAVDHYVQIPVDGDSWTVTDPEGNRTKFVCNKNKNNKYFTN